MRSSIEPQGGQPRPTERVGPAATKSSPVNDGPHAIIRTHPDEVNAAQQECSDRLQRSGGNQRMGRAALPAASQVSNGIVG
jgi:hypothetical protein